MVPLERFFSETLGLTELPPFLPTFYGAFLAFLLVHQVVAPILSLRWFPVAFGEKRRAAKNNWSTHVVSQVHAFIVVPYALRCILTEKPHYYEDLAFEWNPEAGHLLAIACGYFLWDTLDSIINFTDLGFVVHGVSCFLLFLTAFRPFMAYYGPRCLLWETSTIFLNNHWFLDKLGRTGSVVQAFNGFFLLGSFFCVRLIYGGVVSYHFFQQLHTVRDRIPLAYILLYGGGDVVLQSLSWFWFFKMISALRKRFKGNGN